MTLENQGEFYFGFWKIPRPPYPFEPTYALEEASSTHCETLVGSFLRWKDPRIVGKQESVDRAVPSSVPSFCSFSRMNTSAEELGMYGLRESRVDRLHAFTVKGTTVLFEWSSETLWRRASFPKVSHSAFAIAWWFPLIRDGASRGCCLTLPGEH